MSREDPMGLRRYADATMIAHASGHLREVERSAVNGESNGAVAGSDSSASGEFGGGEPMR